jgi:hypothetical protein
MCEQIGGVMAIHELPKKMRARAHGDLTTLAKESARCYVSAGGAEIHFGLIVPDSVFYATIKEPTSCTLSTRSGDTGRAVLMFD